MCTTAQLGDWVGKGCYVKKGIPGNHATRVKTWAIYVIKLIFQKICILADGTSTQHSNQKQRMKKSVKVNAIYVSLSMYLPICTNIITFVYIYTVYPSIYIYIYIYIDIWKQYSSGLLSLTSAMKC